MSWHGPSAPRVEGMATKSAVVASCVSKPASTASRILCVVSVFTAFLVPRRRNCGSIKAQMDRPCGEQATFQNHRRAHTIRRSQLRRGRMADNRVSDNKNVLYLIICVLLVAVAVLGFNLYQAKKQPEGLQINVGPDGLKIQNK